MLAEQQSHNDLSVRLAALGLDPAASRVLIVGLGKTGLSVARLLARNHISFAVVDTRSDPPGLEELRQEMPDAAVFLGGLKSSAFKVATDLVVSPGLALDYPEIRRARRAGLNLFSDIDLFAALAQAPVVAITGSNGKSTVTTLVGLMARHAGLHAEVGANLGIPALDLLTQPAPDFYVLELSSFQLERTSRLQPLAATVLNVSPDHMDRYRDDAAYGAAKRRIFAGAGTMVLNADDVAVRAMAEPGRACVRFSIEGTEAADYHLLTRAGEEYLARRGEALMPVREVRLRGRHNLANALAALALGDAMGLPLAPMLAVLRQFPGLPHRMEWVAEKDRVAWINDSKATNVGACLAALDGLDGRVVLIAGGDGKGADFSPLLPALVQKVRAAVLMGKDAERLEALLQGRIPLRRVQDMTTAVAAAHRLAQAGDCVLLSPACASLDQFRDYQERGRIFAEQVRRLLA